MEMPFSPADERLVILSDQHKGACDGADDFQRCERSYNAALTYYERLGYRLILLGDVEELWENSFEEVSVSYPETLALEAKFISDDPSSNRYTRVWGNHDLAWSDAELFREQMEKHGAGGVEPVEAVRLLVGGPEGGRPKELLLAHGHQGTDDSDRNAWTSRFFVRRGWRWLQRRLNRPWNTPAVDWGLRGQHAELMYEWALDEHAVLIAGHTHLPVFFHSQKEMPPAGETPSPADTAGDEDEAQALAQARQEWLTAERRRLARQKPIELDVPCYFNTGCCSFGDGDITGIELREGQIRLVRWPSEPNLTPEVLAAMDLSEVFELVEAAR